MGVHVDKAGCHDLARDVDLARPPRLVDDADRGNPVARDRDIGPIPRPAAAIDHLAATQNEVGHARLAEKSRMECGKLTWS